MPHILERLGRRSLRRNSVFAFWGRGQKLIGFKSARVQVIRVIGQIGKIAKWLRIIDRCQRQNQEPLGGRSQRDVVFHLKMLAFPGWDKQWEKRSHVKCQNTGWRKTIIWFCFHYASFPWWRDFCVLYIRYWWWQGVKRVVIFRGLTGILYW